jgi:hypothetical protein
LARSLQQELGLFDVIGDAPVIVESENLDGIGKRPNTIKKLFSGWEVLENFM